MSSLGDSMSDAIKRRTEKLATETPATPVDRKTQERLDSEAAQRKAYEARLKREQGAK